MLRVPGKGSDDADNDDEEEGMRPFGRLVLDVLDRDPGDGVSGGGGEGRRRKMNAAFRGDFVGRVVLESWEELRRLVQGSAARLGRERESPAVARSSRLGSRKREALKPFGHFMGAEADGVVTERERAEEVASLQRLQSW